MAAVNKSLPRRQFDVVVVGAGGAGLRCSLQLAQAGLSLGQADVGDQQPGQQAQGQAPSARNGDSTFSLDGQVADTATATATTIPRTVTRPDALVDTFA